MTAPLSIFLNMGKAKFSNPQKSLGKEMELEIEEEPDNSGWASRSST